MIKRFKVWIRTKAIRFLFTPVRAIKLVKANVRADGKITSISVGQNKLGGTMYIHYEGYPAVEMFMYHKDEMHTLWAEAEVVRRLV